MATNRYVGARYVPIFAGDWDNTQEYEPLTIVSYQGDSYTSRGYVPTGIEITNGTYWAKTGNFNQQVAYLQDKVQDAEDDIEDINDDIDDLQTDVNNLVSAKNQWLGRFQVQSVSVEIGSIAGNSMKSGESASIAQSWGTPLAIIGWNTGDKFIVSECCFTESGSSKAVHARAYNTDSEALNCEVAVDVLYFNTEAW